MKRLVVFISMMFALAGCLQAGTEPQVACAGASAECLRAAFAAMAPGVPGEGSDLPHFNRDRDDSGKAAGAAGSDGGSAAGADNGASTSEDSAQDGQNAQGNDDGAKGDDDGAKDDKGNKGNKGHDRNRNAVEKGDNRFDGRGNADDTHG